MAHLNEKLDVMIDEEGEHPVAETRILLREIKPVRNQTGVWMKQEPTGAIVINTIDGRFYYQETNEIEWELL